MATISSHILDSVSGDHARGIRVACYRLNKSGNNQQLFDVIANEEGRISEALGVAPGHQEAQYELVFYVADYFKTQIPSLPARGQQIMPEVVIRIRMPSPEARYHIPLVLSPHSYTIWWSG